MKDHKSVLKYFTWNAILIVPMILASVFNIKAIIIILTVWYCFEAAVYFLAIWVAANTKKGLKAISPKWCIVFEALFCIIPFYLGHYVVFTCMVATLLEVIYIVLSQKAPSNK